VKTWKVEMIIVASILLAINGFKPQFNWIELLAAVAVLLTFGHAQIADRMAEQEELRKNPSVDCYKKARYYFIGKEILWFSYFLLNHSYSALAGVGIFLAYPFWRRFYRARIKTISQY